MKNIRIHGHYIKIEKNNITKAKDCWEGTHSDADQIVIENDDKEFYSAIAVYKDAVERIMILPTNEKEVNEDPMN